MAVLSFKLNDSLYLRDPQASELGQKILSGSVRLLDKLGAEHFTFRKLAEEIGSTEAGIYRYFENKQRLLLYLIDWYWTWLEFRIDYSTINVTDPRERLRISLRLLCEEKENDPSFAFMDEPALQRIVTTEFEKTYLTKQVDEDNRYGVFLPYKSVCKKIAGFVREINPKFPFPHTLVSTILLTSTHQLFYAEHLPSLTDIKHNPSTHFDKLEAFIQLVAFKTLE
jgi:AcrR family transcriptional regulator